MKIEIRVIEDYLPEETRTLISEKGEIKKGSKIIAKPIITYEYSGRVEKATLMMIVEDIVMNRNSFHISCKVEEVIELEVNEGYDAETEKGDYVAIKVEEVSEILS